MGSVVGFSPWRSHSHRSWGDGLPLWGQFNLALRGHNFTSFTAVLSPLKCWPSCVRLTVYLVLGGNEK